MALAAPASSPTPPSDEDDRTARARIRDAALRRFAEDGYQATSLRVIAEDAGVSAPLVVHHFGSKDGLRAACDEYVAERIRVAKRAALGGGADPLQTLREVDQGLPLLRYLAQALAEGSAHVAALVDELVEDAVAYSEEGVASGALRPTDYPRQRAVVLTMWSLGALVLHEHVERLLGVDITRKTDQWLEWVLPASEILARGVLTERFHEQWREAAEAYLAHGQETT